MKKNYYIKPQVKIFNLSMKEECMLETSTGGSLPDTDFGGNSSGMEADSNENNWSGGIW